MDRRHTLDRRTLRTLTFAWENGELSRAERRALIVLSHGLSLGQAGFMLGVSAGTIKKQGAGAMDKLGARTMTHAIAQAIRAGLIP